MELSNNSEHVTASAPEQKLPWWMQIQLALFAIGFVILTSFVAVMQFTSPDQVTLDVGDVAPQDIRAPGRKTFVSQVLTAREKERAEAMVRDVYDPPNARMARDQLAYVQKLCDYLSAIRSDPYSPREQKIFLIQTIPGLNLSRATVGALLDLNTKSWQTVVDQTLYVLDQTMRQEIRENQLPEVKRALPAAVSLDLSDEQAEIVIALARDLVKPNSLYNAEKTAEAKRLARDNVEPVMRTIEKGEIIVRAGDVVNAQHLEALDAFELRQTHIQWPFALGAFLFMSAVCITLTLYLRKFSPEVFTSRVDYPLLLALLLLFTFGARLVIAQHVPVAYLYPFATLAIVVSVFFGTKAAVGLATALALITAFISRGSPDLAVYALVGGLVASLGLSRVDRLSVLLWTGVHVTLANVSVILAFRLSAQPFDGADLALSLSFGMINGLVSASMAFIFLLFLGSLAGKTTTLQLIELTRPTHPLLRQLLLKAPGTYHHSLLVSNMAEQAAEQIGANSILARVGAYYHDIGKMLRPYFFVDNQAGGENVHERLDPQMSAQIVISHVRDGLELAQKYRLPSVIQEFIAQHHGTTVTNYFYQQALEMHQEGAPPPDRQRFTYPGPRPRRREVGIVMLADSCEAAVRAERPSSPAKINELIKSIIDDRLMSGELSDSDLTMRDLDTVRAAFLNILQGVFHPRVKYPGVMKSPASAQPVPMREPDTAFGQTWPNDQPAPAAQPDPLEHNAEGETGEQYDLSGKEKVIRFRRV